MSTRLLVDSACDLPENLIAEYDIEVLPFVINVDEESFLDGEEITTSEVFAAMEENREISTDQVKPGLIMEAFKKQLEDGFNVLYLAFSGKLSGTYQTASMVAEEMMKEYPEMNIDVVDSKSGSVATGILAQKTAALLEKGRKRKHVLNKLQNWIDNIEHIFVLDDLEALRKGGRIGRAKSMVGNFLKVKPLLALEDGEIILERKVRGSARALQSMINLFQKKCDSVSGKSVGISHANDRSRAEKLKENLEEMGADIFCVEMINSVLGVHLGQGGVGLFFLSDKN